MSKKRRPTPVPAPTIPGLIDAHTHLASAGAADPEAIRECMARAADAGVQAVCTVGDGLAEAEQALAAAHAHPQVYAACAVHPTRAGELDESARARLTEMAADPRCVAVGETGMDAYWVKHAPDTTADLDVQEEAFRWHIALAVQANKALMIHNREADAAVLRILGSLAPEERPPHVILHCFSSPLSVAREAIDRGYVLSFAGNVTFKRNEELREAARLVPADQLLIETDAPYMTPEPFRGGRNEPSLIGHTATCVAQVRGVAPEVLARDVRVTFENVYQITL